MHVCMYVCLFVCIYVHSVHRAGNMRIRIAKCESILRLMQITLVTDS